MQIFYTTIIAVFVIIFIALVWERVAFTSENITVIIEFFFIFAMVMAGANVGEWFMKTKLGNTENKA